MTTYMLLCSLVITWANGRVTGFPSRWSWFPELFWCIVCGDAHYFDLSFSQTEFSTDRERELLHQVSDLQSRYFMLLLFKGLLISLIVDLCSYIDLMNKCLFVANSYSALHKPLHVLSILLLGMCYNFSCCVHYDYIIWCVPGFGEFRQNDHGSVQECTAVDTSLSFHC